MPFKSHRSSVDRVGRISLNDGICAFTFGTRHHVTNAGNGFAHVRRVVGYRDNLAAMVRDVTKANNTMGLFS